MDSSEAAVEVTAKQNSQAWQEQEQEWVMNFFTKLVPEALLGKPSHQVPGKADCDSLAAQLLNCDDIEPVDNQGSVSYTVISKKQNKIVQFRLRRLNEAALSLAHETYGECVPQMKYVDDSALPTYIAPVLPGQIHILQQFPEDRFPLERQIRTVQDVARFVAKGAFKPQPKDSYAEGSWTRTAKTLLLALCNNKSLMTVEPRFAARAASLIPKVSLLDQLPPVLTNPDFAEINMMVDISSGALTGVLDFDDAQVEAFGMSIFGVYEGFFGHMKDGIWYWFNQAVSDVDNGRTVCQVLHSSFWEAFWLAVPTWFTKEKYNQSIQMALDIGILNRYFVRGLQNEYNGENDDHVRGVEWARGIWLGRDFLEKV